MSRGYTAVNQRAALIICVFGKFNFLLRPVWRSGPMIEER